MSKTHRATTYRHPLLWAGAALCVGGLSLVVRAAWIGGAGGGIFAHLALVVFGLGPLLEVILQSVQLPSRWASFGSGMAMSQLFVAGAILWMVGWALVASGIRRVSQQAEPTLAAGAPLHPRLAAYRDFNWLTLTAYGGGILLAELVLLVLHTLLARGVDFRTGGAGPGLQFPPALAFGIAMLCASGLAFVAGFIGASRSQRVAAPEATIALVYLGLPLPIVLSALHEANSSLGATTLVSFETSIRYALREVTYLAGLLGRPELGYALAFAGLVLVMIIGITAGFIGTASGRLDLKAGFELFVARRHTSVFHPRLLLGTLAVMLLLIIPPLIIYAILKAAGAAVERSRLRSLGQTDPIHATEAENAWKLREQTPTEMMTALSVGGVAVGVMALIVVMSVMSGFEQDLQQKILGTNAHAVVLKYADDFSEYPEVMEKIAQVDGVIGQTPFIMNEVMVSSEGNIAGAVIKGIDPDTVGTVTDLPKNVVHGSLAYLKAPEKLLPHRLAPQGAAAPDERPAPRKEDLEDDPMIERGSAPSSAQVLPGILLGRELAASLRVVVGDRVNVVSPLGGELGPQGPMPKSRPFRVAAIFYSGMFEYDSKFVYIGLPEAQSFFSVKGATGIELKVTDIHDARRISRRVLDTLDGYPYRTKDWGEMNKNLFAALRLEKLVMGLILSIIVIVAAGLIVATLIMLVLEKRKEIAVLKALGVPDGGIVKIFLIEGLQIGLAGGLLGLFAGIAWCLFIDRVGFSLNPDVYYIPRLPVRLEPLQTTIPVVVAILLTYLASIYPALKAARVEPVEGLKAE